MFHIDDPLIIVSLVLQATVIFFLLQGAFQKYRWVLAYSIARLATSIMEVLALHEYGKQAAVFRNLYYADRVILNLALFLMVTSIIYRLLEGKPQHSMIGRILAGIVVAVLASPFLVLTRTHPIRFLNGMSQFLYFGSGIMTLVLWTVLLSLRSSRDSQLLKFTLGLGIAMTGAAVSFGLQQWMRSPQLVWMPNLFLQVTHVAGLLVWCWAFRPATRQARAPGDALPSH